MSRTKTQDGAPWGHHCPYCGAEVRKVTVLAGKLGQPRPMLIDRFPHRDGCVIKRKDGRLRMLAPWATVKPGVPAYRIHTSRACADRLENENRRPARTSA